MTISSEATFVDSRIRADLPFLQAARCEHAAYTPVWLMRQAGRYLPEYRRIREQLSFLELCTNSEAAAQVTADTVRRLGVDAAIVFADILLPLIPMGLGLHFEKGEGPQIERPLRCPEDVDALHPIDALESLGFVGDTIAFVHEELRGGVPVIGFAGAPFTLASYAIEGGTSRNFLATKKFMYDHPGAWHRLMTYVAEITGAYLRMQIDAGADAVQLFDSWVGCLSPQDYRTFVLPYTRDAIASLPESVPVIYFGTMTGGLLESMRDTGAHVIGLDWRVDIDSAWELLGSGVAVQGNLDPAVLFADRSVVRKTVRQLIDRVAGRRGHIFNLGHGVLPGTPVEHVLELIDAVHEYSAR